LVFKPQPGGGLTYARAALETPFGRAESGWQRTEAGLTVNVTVPPNATAEVHLPAASAAAVTEGGQPLADAHAADGEVVVKIGSGSYTFEVKAA
jgi:alpha-L-rhamnosidase